MRQIYLNHHKKPHDFNFYAITLLGFGIICSLSVFIYHRQLTNQAQSLLSNMQQQKEAYSKSKIDSLKSRGLSQTDKYKYEEITIVNQAIKQLVLPWVGLFKALESINREDVKILALEPNAKNEKVNIKAIAINASSMISYISELSQNKMFKKVTLISQSNQYVSSNSMIEFEVEVLWKI
jgi:hypothetical protein